MITQANRSQQAGVWLCMLCFIVGATMRYDLALIARVPLSEIIAFASIPFLIYGLPLMRWREPLFKCFLILGLWSLGVAVSDIWNGIGLDSFMRGVAKPVFCGLWLLFFLGVLVRSANALIWLPVGGILAALQNYYFPQAWTAERMAAGGYEFAAYAVAPLITAVTLALAVLLYKRGRLLTVFVFIGGGITLALMNAPRSESAMMLLNAFIIGYIWYTRLRMGRHFRLTSTQVVLLSIIILGFCYCLYEGYLYAAREGLLGEMQFQKLREQSDTVFGNSPLGLILAGRTAVFAAILGVIENPLIGYGSWSGIMLTDFFIDAIYYVGTDARELDMAIGMGGGGAGHSILFGAWMENGILAAIALVCIAFIVVKDVLYVITDDHPLAPWIIATATGFMWAFFFSPFGHRMHIGFFLAFWIVYLANAHRQRQRLL